MKKIGLAVLVLMASVGCSSDDLGGQAGEREDLESEVASEDVESDSEDESTTTTEATTTTEPTPTTVVEELSFADFGPTCSINRLDSIGTLWFDLSITNAFEERTSFFLTVDLFYDGEWFNSESSWVRDIPSGRTGTDQNISLTVTDGRSSSALDYSCEVAEFEYR